MKKQDGFSELKAKLLELAESHPKIGIGKGLNIFPSFMFYFSLSSFVLLVYILEFNFFCSVRVPQSFVLMQKEIEEKKKSVPYLWWGEYIDMASDLGMFSYN